MNEIKTPIVDCILSTKGSFLRSLEVPDYTSEVKIQTPCRV